MPSTDPVDLPEDGYASDEEVVEDEWNGNLEEDLNFVHQIRLAKEEAKTIGAMREAKIQERLTAATATADVATFLYEQIPEDALKEAEEGFDYFMKRASQAKNMKRDGSDGTTIFAVKDGKLQLLVHGCSFDPLLLDEIEVGDRKMQLVKVAFAGICYGANAPGRHIGEALTKAIKENKAYVSPEDIHQGQTMLGSLGLGIYILVSFWLQTLLFYLGMTGCFTKCLAGHLQQKHVNRRVGARAEEHPKENWNHNISIEFATHYNNIMTPSLLLFMMETILIIVTGANKIFIGMNCSVVDRASYKMLIAPSQLFIVWSAMIHWVKLYGILPPRGDYAKWAIFRALHGGIIADSTLSNIICGSSRRNLTRQWTQFPMEAWGGSEYLPPGLWDLLSEKERTRREDMRKLLRENREPGLMESNSRRQENNPENKGLPSKYDYHSSRPAVQKVMAEPQGIALKTAISKFELEALSDDDDD